HRDLTSFPTRRSSDLGTVLTVVANDGTDAVTPGFSGLPDGSAVNGGAFSGFLTYAGGNGNDVTLTTQGSFGYFGKPAGNAFLLRDRKSTRLNSSHQII